ncbi:PREDICTED: C-type lectin domain family 2 member H-like isoform X2 [Hipposideros armiger]|uniref:C-type lectin domain family 2 member H-like isoform X2 n=1 Tax=Hipposideros armiger TaxID=186990 RepID=A0A8B7QLH3_HIPAR|nr:PREDICTED: C-type lectin domain family 2 member H-like isoform X2 [Hipposideros armiger]
MADISKTPPFLRPTDSEALKAGKNLQRKCEAITSRRTDAKVIYCLIIIGVLVAIVITLPIALAVREPMPVFKCPVYTACPERWIGLGRKCFYFSEDIRNWTYSQAFCVSLKADLARIETLEELKFLKRYKGPSDHWIGLSRESSHHIWKWTDNTEYNATFVIKGAGECAYLNDNGVSSARTYTDRKWICSKPSDVSM